jgi:hypothetical protein
MALAERCGARSVFNPDFAQGMFSSVLSSVSALPQECAGFFIHPVDIPRVRHQTLISGIHAKALKTWMGKDGLRGFLNGYEADAMSVPLVDRLVLKRWQNALEAQQRVEALLRCSIHDL